MYNTHPRHFTQVFSNGKFVFDTLNKDFLKVEAVKDDGDGDWKTALVHGYTGIKKGEQALLKKIWSNCYGVWANIELNGRNFDVRPNSLKLLECHGKPNEYEVFTTIEWKDNK